MKKHILSLVALFATMSIQAQVVKVYKNGTLQETYTNTATDKYKVVFEEAPDANLLTGKFSVSATKKVQFTKGNLQATYKGSTYTWGFAVNQYSYVGNAAGNTSFTSEGKNTDGAVVDLFGWSTSNTNYGINTSTSSSTYSGDFKDWGENFPGKGYSTLSKDEWTYLLSTRMVNGGTGEGKSYQRTTLTLSDGSTTVYGLLIAPDNYSGTPTLSTTTPWSNWTTMESAGVVFQPAAGDRRGSSVDDAGSDGYSWSSTANGSDRAYYVYFTSYGVYPEYRNGRYYGQSVRLVSVASE